MEAPRRSSRARKSVNYSEAVLSQHIELEHIPQKVDVEDEEKNESETSTDEDIYSGEDNKKEKTKIKKRRISPASTQEEQLSAQRQHTRKRRRKSVEEEEENKRSSGDEEGNDIYSALYNSKTPIKSVVLDWVDLYKNDNASGLSVLISLVTRSAGYLIPISVDDIEESIEDIIKSVVEAPRTDFDTSTPNKKFHDSFIAFWSKLCSYVQYDILFDETFTYYTIQWLVHLSCCTFHDLRLYASSAAFAFMNGLIFIAVDFERNLSVKKKQLSTEEKKKISESSRMKQLSSDIEEQEGQLSFVHSILEELFNGVFVHRYRDIRTQIRVISLQALAKWITFYPSYFLHDSFLKYIGWQLNDKEASVRKAAIQAVLSTYNIQDILPKLEFFTQRFLKRFQELTLDKSADVAALAIDLMKNLLISEMLEEGQGDDILRLIWDKELLVCKAAASFAYEDHVSVPEDEDEEDIEPHKQRKQVNLKELVRLITFLDQYWPEQNEDDSEDEETIDEQIFWRTSADYCITGFWDFVAGLHDWELICDLLLQNETGKAEKRHEKIPELSEKQQNILICLLVSSISQLHQLNSSTISSKSKKKSLNKRDKEALDSFTLTIIPRLPSLLTTFQVDALKISFLVQLSQFLDIDQFFVRRQQKQFSNLLSLLRTIFLKHASANASVLKEVADAFYFLTFPSNSNNENQKEELEVLFVDESYSFVKQLAHELRTTLNDLIQSDELDTQLNGDILVCLMRIRMLGTKFQFSDFSFSEEMDDVFRAYISVCIEEENDTDNISFAIADELLQICSNDLNWNLYTLYKKEGIEKSGEELQDQAQEEKKATEERIITLHTFLSGHFVTILHQFSPTTAVFNSTLFSLSSFILFYAKLENTTLDFLSFLISQELNDLYVNKIIELFENNHTSASLNIMEALRDAIRLPIYLYPKYQEFAGKLLSFYDRTEFDPILHQFMSQLRLVGDSCLLGAILQSFIYFQQQSDSDADLLNQHSKRMVSFFSAAGKKRVHLGFFKAAIDYGLSIELSPAFDFLISGIAPFVRRTDNKTRSKTLEYLIQVNGEIVEGENEAIDAFVQVLKGDTVLMEKKNPSKRKKSSQTKKPQKKKAKTKKLKRAPLPLKRSTNRRNRRKSTPRARPARTSRSSPVAKKKRESLKKLNMEESDYIDDDIQIASDHEGLEDLSIMDEIDFDADVFSQEKKKPTQPIIEEDDGLGVGLRFY